MNTLAAVFRELIGLFIDDGSLAVAVLLVIALAGVSASQLLHVPMAAGAVLLFGCLGALVENVMRAGRHPL